MYLSGPSVLACCAGKAVLILILPPSIFKPARRSGMSITLLHYAQVVCCGYTLVAENGNESYSLCRPYPGGPLGAAAAPFSIRSIRIRVVSHAGGFFGCYGIISSPPAPIRLSRSRHLGTADLETSTDNSGHPSLLYFPSSQSPMERTHAPCRLVAVLIPASSQPAG